MLHSVLRTYGPSQVTVELLSLLPEKAEARLDSTPRLAPVEMKMFITHMHRDAWAYSTNGSFFVRDGWKGLSLFYQQCILHHRKLCLVPIQHSIAPAANSKRLHLQKRLYNTIHSEWTLGKTRRWTTNYDVIAFLHKTTRVHPYSSPANRDTHTRRQSALKKTSVPQQIVVILLKNNLYRNIW